jgi:signal transduction histidine kinase
MIIVSTLNPPMSDVRLLLLFMALTGGISSGATYILYRQRMLQGVISLRWTLLAVTLLTVGIIFVNVLVTAHLMFISNHDLVLTSALLIFSGTISILAVYLISGSLLERIRALSEAAQNIAQGQLQTRLMVSGSDELTQLAQTFNAMAAALEAVEEQKQMLEQTRRDLITWVSHDLRTPLAAARVLNEALLDGVVTDPETVTRYQKNIQKEIRHLGHLIDDLFELAQLDTGHLKLTRQMTSIHDLISDTLGSMQARAAAHQITLTGEVEQNVPMVLIAPDKIQRVLNNLLDNALHHTPVGGSVHLHARCSGGALEISVRNTGSGIAPADLSQIFTSFYRGETSRSQSSTGYRGTGLGLAIARGFVEAHGGKIWAESVPDADTTFTFSLPVSG